MDSTIMWIVVGFCTGCLCTGIVWGLLSILGGRSRARTSHERDEAVSGLGKLLSEIDSLITSHNLGDVEPALFRKRLTTLLDSFNRTLKTSMHLIDGFHVKYFETAIGEHRKLLYSAVSAPKAHSDIVAPERLVPDKPQPAPHRQHESTPVAQPRPEPIPTPAPAFIEEEPTHLSDQESTPAPTQSFDSLPDRFRAQPHATPAADPLTESLSTQETMRIDIREIKAHLRAVAADSPPEYPAHDVAPPPETSRLFFSEPAIAQEESPVIDLQPETEPAWTQQEQYEQPLPISPEQDPGTAEPFPELFAQPAQQPVWDNPPVLPTRTEEEQKAKNRIFSGEDVAQQLDSFFGFEN